MSMTRLKRIISAITAVTIAADTAAMAILDEWLLPALALTAAGLAAAFAYAFASANDATRKVIIMLEAFRNNDFSFRLHERGNPEITESLAGVSEIIKEQKIAARQKERLYGTIINSVRAGIFVTDDKGNVSLCNTAALRLLGLTVLTNTAQLDNTEPGLRESLENMSSGETRLLSLGNNNHNINVSANVSKINFGERTLSVYILNDVNSVIDRQEVEAWIKLTRVLTHEIMNGIAPIRAMSDSLLNSGTDDPKRVEESLEVISSTSDGLMKFTKSFRKFAAIPSPELSLNYVRDLANDAVALMHESLAAVKVVIDIQPEDIIVQADKNLISHVLVNLLKNAIEAGATAIRINSRTIENESVTIDVIDNGQPVSDECAEQIFVPFFTTKRDGSGIGLSVARRIMNLHGGTLQLINNPTKKTFRLLFP